MRLQDVLDTLENAEELVRRQPMSSGKTDILTLITKAQKDLGAFSDEIVTALDRVSKGLDRL